MQAESVLREPSKIHYFFGKFRFVFPKKVKKNDYFLEKKNSSTSKCSTVGHGRSGDPLRSIALTCLASALLSLYSFYHAPLRLLHPPSTAHTVLASLGCARCFGELIWDAACGSNFGEQLWGTTVGSNFTTLQQHGRTIALNNDSFGE